MKFQKLTIHNIASIEDAVIDFESKPLADSEVFLITGKTGAGKSTILDAICLALYADTPRLDGTRMQGETKDCDKTVKIDDPRQLMRRNTAEASVSLAFTGNDGVHYEAIWAVARARKRPGGNIQPKDWQLKNLNTGSICMKDKEIEAGIKAATGLDFSQFCRTTMLAQGEFTRFLDSRDEDKAEILEKITGADIYSKIGARIYEITGQKKQVWDDAVRLINDTKTFSEDEIKVRKDEIERLDNEYGRFKADTDRKSVILQWLRTEEKLRKEISDAAEAHRLAAEALESEDFRKKSDLVRIWEVTADARGWYSQMLKSESERKHLKEEFIPLSEEFGRLLGGQAFIRQQAGMLETAVRDIDAFLEKEKGNVSVYENAQTVIGHLKTMAECRTAIAGSLKTIAEEKDALEKIHIPALEKAKAAEQEAKGILEREEKEISLMADAVTALDLPGLRSRRDAAKEAIARTVIAKERIGTLSKEKRRLEEISGNLAVRMEAIVEKEKKIASMAAGIHDAELERNIRRQDLEKLKDSVDDFAIAIRQKLQIGDTCPVCMQKIKSAIPHEEELQALTGGLQAAFEEAENRYSGLVMERQKLEAEVKADKDEYERARTAYEQDSSVPEAMEKALLACRECGINDLDGSTLTLLEKIGKDAEADIGMLDIAINDGTAKETAVRERQKALSVKRRDAEVLSAKVQEAESKVNSCRNRLATAETLVRSKQEDMLKAGNAVRPILTGTLWDAEKQHETASVTNWQDDPSQTAEALQSAATGYFQKVQDRQKSINEYDSLVSTSRNLENIIGSILRTAPKWQEIMPSESGYIPDILTKANDLNTGLTSLATRYRTATGTIKDNRALLDSFLAGNPDITIEKLEELIVTPSDSIKTANGYINGLINNAVTKKALLEESIKRHGKHLQDKPETDENDTAESLEKQIAESGAVLSAISEKKGALNLELETDAANRKRLGGLIADADRKNAEYQKWSRMNQLLGDATGNKFRKIAQSYVLSSLIHSANNYMKSLTDRYTLKVMPGTFVISLEDAYQGFASRAASTISGGESFLVSLSLALALSDIGQGLSADTLFIDEGFGTLSGEPLQNAIATLRSLHTKAGRHVGIISHVEELRERIPVQIQVIQDGNNSSSTIRIVPEVAL